MSTISSSSPLVSVIVPVYNAERYLRQTLDCICGQTLKDIEIILVDDGSTDSSLSILEEYAAKDSRIILLQQEHEYAGAARNKGMAIAKGKYFSFLDADDLFEPEMLEKMATRAEGVGAEVVICRSEIFYKDGEYKPLSWALKDSYLKGVDLRNFNFQNKAASVAFQSVVGWPWDKLFLRSYVERNGFTFGPTRHGNDGPFVFPATYAADRISVIDEVLVKYRQMGNQISAGSNLTKNPTACCTSVERIHDAMSKLALPNATWRSFYVWVTTYLRWNMMKFEAKGKNALRDFLLGTFERHFKIVDRTVGSGIDKLVEYKDFVPDMNWYKSIISPAISVVVPVFNAQMYLHECLDSLKKQTFQNFEVICVNDGSTDSSLSILEEYSQKMSCIRIISVPNGGYGKAMNLGMRAARGKYLAILEPDDYLPQKAFEQLYQKAVEHDLQVVKGRFKRFSHNKNGEKVSWDGPSYHVIDKVVQPRSDYKHFYHVSLSIWTGLYSMDFLKDKGIEFHESPGASYQDTGFFMQCLGLADRAMFLNEWVYMYRMDNAASSSNNRSGKPFALLKEFDFVREQMQKHAMEWEIMREAYLMRIWESHRWIVQNVKKSQLMEYLHEFRNMLLELEDVSTIHLTGRDRTEMEDILVSVQYYIFKETLLSKLQEEKRQQTAHDKLCSKDVQKHNSRWFGIPLLQIRESENKRRITLFGFIPIYSRKRNGNRTFYRILGIKIRKTKRI